MESELDLLANALGSIKAWQACRYAAWIGLALICPTRPTPSVHNVQLVRGIHRFCLGIQENSFQSILGLIYGKIGTQNRNQNLYVVWVLKIRTIGPQGKPSPAANRLYIRHLRTQADNERAVRACEIAVQLTAGVHRELRGALAFFRPKLEEGR